MKVKKVNNIAVTISDDGIHTYDVNVYGFRFSKGSVKVLHTSQKKGDLVSFIDNPTLYDKRYIMHDNSGQEKISLASMVMRLTNYTIRIERPKK